MTINDQILDTKITWTMIEAALEKHLKRPIKVGPKRWAEPAQGGGLIASIFLLHLDLCESGDLPPKMLLKVTSKQSMVNVSMALSASCTGTDEELRKDAAIINDTEHHLYENSAKWGLSEEIGIPKYFGGADFQGKPLDAGFILMEFVENVAPVRYYNGISPRAVAQVLVSLAKLNAHFISRRDLLRDIEEHESKEFPVNRPPVRGGYVIERCSSMYLHVASRFPNLKHSAETLAAFARSFNHIAVMWEEPKKYCNYPLLCHSDCHLGNVLWRRDGDQFEMLRIADWQTVHLNNPLIDVCRITFSALAADDFKENLETLLHLYYDTLIENKSTRDLPWDSFEQMKNAYQRVFPLQVTLIGFLLGTEPFVEKQLRTLPESKWADAREIIEGKLHSYVKYAAECVEKWYSERVQN